VPEPAPPPLRRRPRVTLFVHDLAGNAIVRAAPLAAALARDHEVEVVGLLLSGTEVYAPYRHRVEARTVRCGASAAAVLRAAPRLARLASGDVLLACKPLLSTLLPALLAGRRGPRPVLLDVDDDEWSAREVDAPGGGLRGLLRRLRDTHRPLARATHPLVRRVAGVSVASRALQRRYGGTLVRHGPDPVEFDRGRAELRDVAGLRAAFGLPARRRLALFAGRPRRHKGWEVLVDALARPAAAGWDLVLAGPDGPAADIARARLGHRFHALGAVANERMPALLAACDAVPVPQLDVVFARAQLPAKVLEAMAMEVPVLTTPVADLAEILDAGGRGWLVPADDAEALAEGLAAIAADPAEAARRVAAARRWFLAEASVDAIADRLAPLVAAALAGSAG
jgi:glycosyltransferase involved in cell wall biosynthesis